MATVRIASQRLKKFAKMIFREGDAPATPVTGELAMYAKSTGLYTKDSNGTETFIGGATPGEVEFEKVTVDNLVIDGNDISSSSGDITLSPKAGSDVVVDGHWEFDGPALAALTDNNTTITAYAGKNITIESVTFDGGVVGGVSSIDVDGGTIDGAAIGGTTPAAGAFTSVNVTGLTASRGVVTDASKNLASDDAATGTGAPVRATSPTLVAPNLGTPASGTLSNCTAATDSARGVVELATNVETATGTSTTLVVTPNDIKYRLDATHENVIEDLSWLPPVTFTWDPAELVDGAGETSAAIAVPGAALGSTMVYCVAPYDLQGITLNAWVDAANSCKARLQNETGGTINLASGTWVMQARWI